MNTFLFTNRNRHLFIYKTLNRKIPLTPHFTFFKSFLFLLLLIITYNVSLGQDVLLGLTPNGGRNSGGTAFSIKSKGDSFKVLHNFINAGTIPYGDLIIGRDGNFYGMTKYGGATEMVTYGYGTIFKITPSGTITRLRTFDGTAGGNPSGSLLEGYDGNFYGMTGNLGVSNGGTIFQITPSGTFLTFRNFNLVTGYNPSGNLVYGPDSSFYGMTSLGGTYNFGTIFKMSRKKIITVLKNLDNTTTGSSPTGSLLLAADSNFYGMTSEGGSQGYGTIFRISPKGVFTVINNLRLITMGGFPHGSLIKDSIGNFYGMATKGGKYGYGTIFKMTKAGMLTILKSFDSSTTGSNPFGSLKLGIDGNLYGMADKGGRYGYGTIFKITPTGILTVLRSLNNIADGTNPLGSLVQGQDNNLYGMTSGLDTYAGTIFKISTTGAFSVLAQLPDQSSGYSPNGSLVQGKDGYYYGTSSTGGAYSFGTIFKMCSDGTFKTLYSFNYFVGAVPKGSLVQAKDGNFYGMTSRGGTNNVGTIFKINTAGKLTVLKNLNDSSGSNPNGSLIQAKDGNFYGMTSYGGTNYHGTVFKMDTSGRLTVLKNLDFASTGGNPQGSLLQASHGDFYGMTSLGGSPNYYATSGTIFKISSTGVFTVLKLLDNYTGSQPTGDLIQCGDGNFYGMTSMYGDNGAGTIFKMTPAGIFTVIKSLGYYDFGSAPKGSLVQGSDNYLYGMASFGTDVGYGGSIFKITPAGIFSEIYKFHSTSAGNSPIGNLIIQAPNPVANAQTVSATGKVPKKILLSGAGPGAITYLLNDQPKHGIAVIANDTLTYTASADYAGKDSLTFYTSWGCQQSKPAKININISSIKNNAPSISFIATLIKATPAATATILFSADASDEDGKISKVEFFDGDSLLQTEHLVPYDFNWQNVPEGNYTLTAKATDNSGLVSTSAPVLISVVNLPPVVKITSPFIRFYQGSAKVTLRADAGDPDGTIKSVDFYNQNTFLFSKNIAPYSGSYTLPSGSYNLYAIATDNNGKVTVSPSYAIYVQNYLPDVNITSPVNNASYSAPVTGAKIDLSVYAYDLKGKVISVDYLMEIL